MSKCRILAILPSYQLFHRTIHKQRHHALYSVSSTTAASEICLFSYHFKKAALFPNTLYSATLTKSCSKIGQNRNSGNTTAAGKLLKEDSDSTNN